MKEEQIHTTEQLVGVLAGISFAPSCVDFGWRWEIQPVVTEEDLPASIVNPVFKEALSRACRGWLVNTTFRRPDTNSGKVTEGAGRQEFIPKGASLSSVVKTCFLLCKLIVEHEIMESFCFNGTRPFDPHNSVDDLCYIQEVKDRPTVPYGYDPSKVSVKEKL
jgi:hypothetical protein